MKCDCCARKKGWFEVYEPIQYEGKKINLCVDCCKQVYKIRDAQRYSKTDEANHLINTVLAKKSTATFTAWFDKNYVHKGEPPV